MQVVLAFLTALIASQSLGHESHHIVFASSPGP